MNSTRSVPASMENLTRSKWEGDLEMKTREKLSELLIFDGVSLREEFFSVLTKYHQKWGRQVCVTIRTLFDNSGK